MKRFNIEGYTKEDEKLIKEIIKLVASRSAALVATQIVTILNHVILLQ